MNYKVTTSSKTNSIKTAKCLMNTFILPHLLSNYSLSIIGSTSSTNTVPAFKMISFSSSFNDVFSDAHMGTI